MSASVSFVDFDPDRAIRDVQSTIIRALQRAGNEAIRNASQTTAFKGVVLKNSVRARFLSKYTIRIHTGAKHASFLEDGTRPHVIKARRAPRLSFVANGVRVFAKSVKHPGQRPTKWFSKAVEQAWESSTAQLVRDLNGLQF